MAPDDRKAVDDRKAAEGARHALVGAADAMRSAERDLKAAMLAADAAQVGRNEIARVVAGIYSRQTVLDMLAAAETAGAARAAATRAGLAANVDVRIRVGTAGRALASVGCPQRDRRDIAAELLDVLHGAGLRLMPFQPRELANGQTLVDVLADVDGVAEIRRTGDDQERTTQ
ncbi:MAG TPA: hypothetical protein VFB84_10935 [Micromonosporaceae bacterium]|nr:hypothetical protein [Micromonosporaceae bacterium]